MTYRLKPLPADTTVAAFLDQRNMTCYSQVGRGKAVLDSERYFASLKDARPGTIVYYFASDITKWEEILAKLQKANASLLIVNSELSLILEPKPNQTILYCQHPKMVFAQLVQASAEAVSPALVTAEDPSCRIGANVQIEEGARIGSNACIEANCRIYGNVTIGNNVTIKPNTVIGGQGFEFFKDAQGQLHQFPHTGGVVIEDNVSIGAGVVIDAALFDNTVIHKGTKIDNLASIAHNVEIGEQCLIMANTSIAGSVRIGDRTRICLAAAVRDGVSVGSDTVIGMNACVTRDIPNNTTAYGVPAEVIRTSPTQQVPQNTRRDMDDTARIARLVREATLERLQLDLSGLTVISEAATGPFAVTANIAAMSGAEVLAIAEDSPHGTWEDAAAATMKLAQACGVERQISIVRRADAPFAQADIVTNSGFVRPLDQSVISQLRPGAIIPLMYDSCELRPGEIDLDACRERGIRVLGTNENHPLADVFSYCGPLAVKLVLESGIELQRAHIAVAGENFFTRPIVQALENLRADVTVVSTWSALQSDLLSTLDALLFVDYWQRLGPAKDALSLDQLRLVKGIRLIQFVGGLDVETFGFTGWQIYPSQPLPPHRMWRTLGYLGPRPVIELHAAGLKCAELELKDVPAISGSEFDGLRQPIVVHQPTEIAYCC